MTTSKELLRRARRGELSPAELETVAAQLRDRSTTVDRFTLLHILGEAGDESYRGLIEHYLGSHDDPMLARLALDLRAGIARQLTALGISAIDIDPRCTVEDRNLFSHRRDAPTGRLASLVWME